VAIAIARRRRSGLSRPVRAARAAGSATPRAPPCCIGGCEAATPDAKYVFETTVERLAKAGVAMADRHADPPSKRSGAIFSAPA
jgi:hypothetical protein